MIAGQNRPRIEKQIAPTREMIGPRSGTATATPTEKKNVKDKINFIVYTFEIMRNVKINYCHYIIFVHNFVDCLTLILNKISNKII